ncbi:hypothetical protein JOC55_003066 [Paenibacillus sacheonensis]|nr:hypothetical protein [Paenibacillus sacheonensis]
MAKREKIQAYIKFGRSIQGTAGRRGIIKFSFFRVVIILKKPLTPQYVHVNMSFIINKVNS